MRTLFTLLLAGISTAVFSQATFNAPESVEYDAQYHRWIVGNNGDGTVVSYYPQSNLTIPFCSGLSSGPHGIEIMGTNVYICDGASLKGYDLASGSQNFNLNLGATFLNGITTDGSNYLFVTDFSAKKIYRVDPVANTFFLMATTIKTPNGIYYDGANNRCVFVTWGSNAPVQAMSLGDSTVTTLLATSMSNCDGITRDNAGYWYVTTWGGNALRMIDPTFSSAPVSVMTGLSSPADIDINTAGDSIGIPNSGNLSNVVFYTSITTGIASPDKSAEINLFPNPATDKISIAMPENYSGGTAVVFDLTGKAIIRRSFSGNKMEIDLAEFAAGTYFLEIRDMNGMVAGKKEFVKN